ncbi:IclR family transcriptional regulator [Niallia sp. Krafla_26]|uniref:IclR family transcriptional regulator n=1 Tax=Niallia sp. Krafla_26 TaxID=3064703 RepID=UPI003D17B8E1
MDPFSMNKSNYSSFRNALRILNLFSMDQPELQLKDIMKELGVGKSTAFRLVHSLTEEGFIIRDSSSKSYRLAASLLAKGQTIIHTEDLCHLSLDVLENLAEKTHEAAHISILKDFRVLYLLKVDSAYPVHLLSHAGRQSPLHCTSSGQVLLAFQSDTMIRQVIEKGLTAFTANTITNSSKLEKVLEYIRIKGFAVCKEEHRKGITSIAGPVKNTQNEVIASVSIAGPISRINDRTISNLTREVQQAADEISRRLRESSSSKEKHL